MAKFGKQSYAFKKEREVDSSTSSRDKELQDIVSESEEQRIADKAAAARVLAIQKNIKVIEISQAIAEQNSDTYISIPLPGSINYFDPSSSIERVRKALKRHYNSESEGGTVIRFDLFRKIVELAVTKQKEPAEDLFGDLNTDEFISSINDISTGALSAILANPKMRVEDFVNYSPDKPKDTGLQALALIGVAALSSTLLEKLESVRPINTFTEDSKKEKIRREEAITAENIEHRHRVISIKGVTAQVVSSAVADKKAEAQAQGNARLAEESARHAEVLASLAGNSRSRLVAFLIRLAKAVSMFALIHDATRTDAQAKWNGLVLPEVDEDLANEYKEVMLELYDNPTEDMQRLLNDADVDDVDKVIIEYAMAYIEEFNGKNSRSNFTSWITFVTSQTKDIQLVNMDVNLQNTSDFSKWFNDRETYVIKSSVSSNLGNSPSSGDRKLSPSRLSPRLYSQSSYAPSATSFPVPDFKNSKYVPQKIEDFFSKLPGGNRNTFDVNIMDYIDVGDTHANASSESSDYFMHLMQNNKYTPELVCCVINYILKAFDKKDGEPNISGALDFLKSMRAVIQPIKLEYGNMFEDIVNRLFGDVKSKLLAYAIGEATKFIEKQKDKLLSWMDGVVDDDEFTRFCTPLMDMVAGLVASLSQLNLVINEFLRELSDHLLSFELNIEGGMIAIGKVNSNKLLGDLLDSLILSLETGKLCRYNTLKNSDIHPDAIEIINSNSGRISPDLAKAVVDFARFTEQVETAIDSKDMPVKAFDDPKDPLLTGALSVHKTNEGLSIIETIVKYSSNCNAFGDIMPENLTLRDIDIP